jgi:ADP-heptose:LPS heptosyltransferase
MRTRCLILFPGALGDFICLLPSVERLRQESRVELLARTEFAHLLASVVAVRSLDCSAVNRLFIPGAGEEESMRRFFAPYELIYSWFGSQHRTFASELGRASERKARLFPFRSPDARMHQIDHYLKCIGRASGAVPAVVVKPEANHWCDAYWQRHALNGKPVLVLAPGSGGREKNWPIASYQAIADWWRESFHGAIIVVLGPVEDERGGFAAVCRGTLVARGLNLGQLSALLSRAHLYIGNDSGPTHLAAALGVRTVALFGPSDPRQWAPRGAKVTLVRSGLACSPCAVETMKSCAHRDCLGTLEPTVVIRRLQSLPELVTGPGAEITLSGTNSCFAPACLCEGEGKYEPCSGNRRTSIRCELDKVGGRD